MLEYQNIQIFLQKAIFLTEKKLLEHFTKKNWKEQISNKVIKGKSDKLYVKWKGYNISFNSWINRRGIIEMTEIREIVTEILWKKSEIWITFI